MPADPQKLLADALELPEHARAELAADLLDSLDDEDDEEKLSLEEWHAAWSDEIDRRLQDARAGAVPLIDANDVFRDARARLGK